MPLKKSAPKALIDFTHTLADVSAAAIRPHFRSRLKVENKAARGARTAEATFDPVTAADRAAERVMRDAIARHYPEHGIEGEEFAAHAGSGAYRWVLDPIDGTRAFVSGFPVWGTLIGLLHGSAPVLGMMNQPFTGERVWSNGVKSYWRQPDGKVRPLSTRRCARLAEATLTATHPDLFAPGKDAQAFARVRGRALTTRFGGDCYAYCLLAAGFIDIVVEAGLKTFDIVALIPIIEAAGGVVTSWDGGPPTGGGRIVAAGDPRLHAEALKLLA